MDGSRPDLTSGLASKGTLLLTVALSALAVLSGCAAPGATPRAPDARPRALEARAPAPAPIDSRVHLSLSAEEGALAVAMRLPAVIADRGLVAASPELIGLSLSDARGTVPVTLEPALAQGRGALVRPSRPLEGPVELRYRLRPSSELSVDATELVARGLPLVLPRGDDPLPVVLELSASGAADARAASSFGLGDKREVLARPAELRDATYLVGPLGHATFHEPDGDDEAAWLGYFGFDARWVAAEVAGLRSASDAYVGQRTAAGPSTLLLVAERRAPGTSSFRAGPRGVVGSLAVGAGLSASGRLRIGQLLVGRHLGRAWLGSREVEARGYFWTEGVSRAVARELLFEMGAIDHAERAAELGAMLAVESLSPHAGASGEALARRGAEREAVALAAARGALVATSLEAHLRARSKGKSGLRELVRATLALAARDKSFEVKQNDWLTLVAEQAGEGAAREVGVTLERGAPVALAPDVLGPCYRVERGQLEPFELGLVVSGEPARVTRVLPGSRAAKAGAREGELVARLAYDEGRSDVEAALTIVRDGGEVTLRFRPAGRARVGRVVRRVASVPDAKCQR
jgi:hypothetical protein